MTKSAQVKLPIVLVSSINFSGDFSINLKANCDIISGVICNIWQLYSTQIDFIVFLVFIAVNFKVLTEFFNL